MENVYSESCVWSFLPSGCVNYNKQDDVVSVTTTCTLSAVFSCIQSAVTVFLLSWVVSVIHVVLPPDSYQPWKGGGGGRSGLMLFFF